jgi:hypothetical protein
LRRPSWPKLSFVCILPTTIIQAKDTFARNMRHVLYDTHHLRPVREIPCQSDRIFHFQPHVEACSQYRCGNTIGLFRTSLKIPRSKAFAVSSYTWNISVLRSQIANTGATASCYDGHLRDRGTDVYAASDFEQTLVLHHETLCVLKQEQRRGNDRSYRKTEQSPLCPWRQPISIFPIHSDSQDSQEQAVQPLSKT